MQLAKRGTDGALVQPAKSFLEAGNGRLIELPAVMGILNLTPDSFSDGGLFFAPDRAVEQGLRMAEEGARILDLGAESTRPGAREVAEAEEKQRLLPVLRRLRPLVRCAISVDTRKSGVAEAALEEGADIINDVSGLTFDPRMASVVSRFGAGLVVMHMRGTPETMAELTRYDNLLEEVREHLARQVDVALSAGVERGRIAVDPGFGFAKTAEQSLTLLAKLDYFRTLGYPVLAGVSRKRFVRWVCGTDSVGANAGTVAAVALAVLHGAAIVRVHDVAAGLAAMRMATAVAARRNGDDA